MLKKIEDALGLAIVAIINRGRSAGFDGVPFAEFTYSWWEGSARAGSMHSAAVSEMSLEQLLKAIAPSSGQIPEVVTLGEVTKQYEESQGLMSIFLQSAGKLLRSYFQNVDASFELNAHEIRSTVTTYATALEPPYTYVTTLLWQGFDADDTFTLPDGIEFRRPTEEDFKILGRESEHFHPRVMEMLPLPGTRDWIVTITESLDSQSHGAPGVVIRKLMNAVSLLADGKSAVYVMGGDFADPFMKGGSLFSTTPMRTSGKEIQIKLSANDVDRLRVIYGQVSEVETVPTLKYLAVSFARLEAATTRRRREDALVDFVVGLESLLAPDTENIEVTFRFRLRGAAVLSTLFGDANARLKFMSRVYSARSKAVHGSSIREISDLCTAAERALKEILCWFLAHPKRHSGAKVIMQSVDEAMAAVYRA